MAQAVPVSSSQKLDPSGRIQNTDTAAVNAAKKIVECQNGDQCASIGSSRSRSAARARAARWMGRIRSLESDIPMILRRARACVYDKGSLYAHTDSAIRQRRKR